MKNLTTLFFTVLLGFLSITAFSQEQPSFSLAYNWAAHSPMGLRLGIKSFYVSASASDFLFANGNTVQDPSSLRREGANNLYSRYDLILGYRRYFSDSGIKPGINLGMGYGFASLRQKYTDQQGNAYWSSHEFYDASGLETEVLLSVLFYERISLSLGVSQFFPIDPVTSSFDASRNYQKNLRLKWGIGLDL